MVKASSDLMVEKSWVSAAAAAAAAVSSSAVSSLLVLVSAPWSAVVPLLPAVWEAGPGGVAPEDDDEQLVEEGAVVTEREVLEHALEHDDAADGLENEPEIRQRLRAFHTV